MPSTKGIRAGRAFVELFADDSKLVRGLRRAQRKLRAFGDRVRNLGLQLAGLGSAMLTPMLAAARGFSSMGDQVAKMAKRTGLSVETLSQLRYVASQTGTEFASLEMAFRKMQRSIYDAGRGLSTQVDALNDLGLTFQDLDGLSPEAQFKLLADAISRIEDPTRKAAIAMTLFGRTGTNLLPMFANGAAGIEALQDQARKLGLTMSAEDARAAEDFTDALDRLWKTIKMGVFHVGASLAPVLKSLAEQFATTIAAVGEWIRANEGILRAALAVAAAVVGLGVTLAILGTAISGLGSALAVLATVATGVGTVFKILGAVLSWMLTPIGAVIAAVAALGAYLLYATGAGAKALGWLGEKFTVLRDDAVAAYQGIADALAAGDIGLAVKILWLTLKMEWTRGINFLERAWLNFRNAFLKIGHSAWTGLLAMLEYVWHGLEVGWIESVAFFRKIWSNVASFFARLWQNMVSMAKKAWHWIKSLFSDSAETSKTAVYAEIDRARDAAIRKIDEDNRRAKAQAEADRQSRRDRARNTHDATLDHLGRSNSDKHRQLDREYRQRMLENERDLNDARDEWQKALEEARRKRKQREMDAKDDGPGKLKGPDDLLARAQAAMQGLGGLLENATIGATGTFNVANLQGLQAGGVMDRISIGIDKIERNTRPMRDAEALAFE